MFNPLEHPGLSTDRQGRHWHELDGEAVHIRSADPDTRGRVDKMEALQAAVAVFNRRAALLCPDLESQRAVQRLGLAASTRRADLAALHPPTGTARPHPAGGGQGIWEQLVVHECATCATYHAFLEQETDRRLRQLWELHLQMELADLRTAGDLLRQHEDREPQEVMSSTPGLSTPGLSASGLSASGLSTPDLSALGLSAGSEAPPADEAAKSPGLESEGSLPDVLAEQQERIDRQFQRTLAAAGEARHTAFGQLAWMIAVHETTEEQILHPLTRHLDQADDHLAGHLLDEERRISEALADVSISIGGSDGLAAVHAMLTAHTRREDREEFPRLRAAVAAGELRELGDLVRSAEAQALAGAPARPGMPQASDLVRDVLRPATTQLPAP